MAQLFANNAASTLNGGITTETTELTLQTGDGAKFPALGPGDWFNATLFQRIDGKEVHHEICKVIGRVSDVLYVIRAQEMTEPHEFVDGDYIELRLTAQMDTNKISLAQLHAAMLSF